MAPSSSTTTTFVEIHLQSEYSGWNKKDSQVAYKHWSPWCTVAAENGWTPSTSKKTTSSSMRRQLLAWEFNPGRGRCEKFLPRLAYVFRSHSQSTGNDHFAMLLLRLLKWPSQISTLTRSSLTGQSFYDI